MVKIGKDTRGRLGTMTECLYQNLVAGREENHVASLRMYELQVELRNFRKCTGATFYIAVSAVFTRVRKIGKSYC